MDFPFVCLAAHDSEASSMDPLKRQTSTATPAEPGELLWILGTLTASMIQFNYANPGSSLEDVIAYSQNAVAEFARDAMKQFKTQGSDNSKR